jgi:putative Holliday junction resolvase
MLAIPVAVLRRDAKGDTDLVEIARLVAEREAVEVLVGLPRSLNGGEGRAALIAREYATVLAERVAPVSVRMVDERLSTVEATRGLQQAGIKAKEARKMIDAAAAVVILQHALDAERSGGARP